MLMPTRSDHRQRLRKRRRALDASERQARSDALCRQLSRQPLFRTSKRIAAYLPADGEVETEGLIELAWAMGKQVYLPVVEVQVELDPRVHPQKGVDGRP